MMSFKVTNVGIGTNTGPISARYIPIVKLKVYVGSSAASHSNSSNVTILKVLIILLVKKFTSLGTKG